MSLLGNYNTIQSFVGKRVEIYASSKCEHALFVETGIITNIIYGVAENIFIELDNKVVINANYIVKFEVAE